VLFVSKTYHRRMRWIIITVLSIAGIHAFAQAGRQLGIGPFGRTNQFIASPSLFDRTLFDRTNRLPAVSERRILNVSNRADRSFSAGRSGSILPVIQTNSSLRTPVTGAPLGGSSTRFISGTPGVQGTSTSETRVRPPTEATANPGSESPPP